jgi:hypothetical protein
MMPCLSVWMVRTALLHLGIGFTLGGLILFDKGVAIDPSVWRVLPLHIEFTLIGWLMQLAMGVAYWILPRFSAGPRYGRRTGLAWAAFGLLNLGVIGAGVGQWFSDLAWLALVGRAAELVAVAAFAVYIWPRVKPLATAAGISH